VNRRATPRTAELKRTALQRKPWPSVQGGVPGEARQHARARSGSSASVRTPKSAPAPETGFTAAQRLAIRTRAGNGSAEDACCEICGVWCGRYGGQVHHRQNRQAGGSRRRSALSNGVLAHGTPETGCHGKCTTGTGKVMAEMKAAGFVLLSSADPRAESILLAGRDGGIQVWLDDDAHYVDAQGGILSGPPREVACA
jgi:hypothetical protein